MAKKSDLRVGDRVRFRPTHNKAIELTGTILSKHKGPDEMVVIGVEPDGKIVEVEKLQMDAHTSDVIPFPKEKDRAPAKDETPLEDPTASE